MRRANEHLAIETLLVTDGLFRSSDVQVRKAYVQLVESVRENGGVVRVFSAMHVTGERLNQFSGVAAILRFPLPEEEAADGEQKVEESDDDSDDDDQPFAFPQRKPVEERSEVRDQLKEDMDDMGL